MHNDSRNLGNAVAKIMARCKLRQHHVAGMTGLSLNSVGGLLRKRSHSTPHLLEALLRAFRDPQDSYDLVFAYIQDVTPTTAWTHVRVSHAGINVKDQSLALHGLSTNGVEAFNYAKQFVPNFEDILLALRKVHQHSPSAKLTKPT